MARLTGGGFLEQVAAFMTEINELFGGWRKRADAVAAELRGPDVAYVLVTTPDPLAIREALFFAERLEAQGMKRDALVVNRVHPTYGDLPDPAAIAAALAAAGVAMRDDAPERLRRAAADESRQGRMDRLHLVALEGAPDDAARVDVPALAYDVHDIASLSRIAAVLVP
jgi:anion-transporting  ArsA/GET3 family ATPase